MDVIFSFTDYVLITFAILVSFVLLYFIIRHLRKSEDVEKNVPGFNAPTTGSEMLMKRTGKSPLARNK